MSTNEKKRSTPRTANNEVDLSMESHRETIKKVPQKCIVVKGHDLMIPKPAKGASVLEKLRFYDCLLTNGDFDRDALKVIRKRLYRVDTYFLSTEAIALKAILLRCIRENLNDCKT